MARARGIDQRSFRTGRPGVCSVCKHAQRLEIELAIVKGASLRAVAKTYGVSYDSVWRHCGNEKHFSPKRRLELAGGVDIEQLNALAARQSRSLDQYLAIIRNGLLDLFLTAKIAGDVEHVTMLSSQLNNNLKLLANLSGELRLAGTVNNTQVNIHGDPRYKMFEQRLLDLVRAHPEIKESVLEILTEVEASPSPSPKPLNGSKLPILIDADAIEDAHVGA
jgi:hypothetical protein